MLKFYFEFIYKRMSNDLKFGINPRVREAHLDIRQLAGYVKRLIDNHHFAVMVDPLLTSENVVHTGSCLVPRVILFESDEGNKLHPTSAEFHTKITNFRN